MAYIHHCCLLCRGCGSLWYLTSYLDFSTFDRTLNLIAMLEIIGVISMLKQLGKNYLSSVVCQYLPTNFDGGCFKGRDPSAMPLFFSGITCTTSLHFFCSNHLRIIRFFSHSILLTSLKSIRGL